MQARSWLLRILTGLALILLVGSCASSKEKPKSPPPPFYQPVSSIPEGRGLVYIYRQKHIPGGPVWHTIFANYDPITLLYNGSYYPAFAIPGTYRFNSYQNTRVKMNGIPLPRAKGYDLLKLDVEAGKTYYVKFDIAYSWGPKMTLMDEKIATNEIAVCRLAPGYN